MLVARDLDTLTIAPDKHIKSSSVYLGLRSAYWRLTIADTRETISGIVDQLWDIAVSIEDGDLSQAERDLRAAQDRLMDALARKAPPEEIEELMKQLRQALSKFLNAMAQNQQQQQKNNQQQQGNGQMISPQQLDDMLRNIEDLAKTGARDAAQQMLSQLRDLLENLNRGQPQQGSGNQQMRQTLDQLGNMIMQQRQLLDETHRNGQQMNSGRQPGQLGRQGQQGQQGRQSGSRQPGGTSENGRNGKGQMGRGGAGDLQRRQGELLDNLNSVLDQLRGMGAKVPDGLNRAGSAMGQAEQELGNGRLGSANQQQGRALDNLRKGAQSLAEQLLRNQPGTGGQAGRNNRDPLGRPQRSNGVEFGEDVNVPDQINTQRARNILEELRRRLGQSRRSAEELDYLERLIEQF
jgi:uncharacterized protein (TIGR02302 family)